MSKKEVLVCDICGLTIKCNHNKEEDMVLVDGEKVEITVIAKLQECEDGDICVDCRNQALHKFMTPTEIAQASSYDIPPRVSSPISPSQNPAPMG